MRKFHDILAKEFLIGTLFCLLFISCVKENFDHHTTYTGNDSTATAVKDKPRYLWVDGEANFKRFSYKDSIVYYLTKAKNTGFSHIVVDIRPISGDVFYNSTIVAQCTYWNGYTRNIQWDYLQTFIDEGAKLGLKVLASMNVFSGGQNFLKVGAIFRDEMLNQKATLLNLPEGLTLITNINTTKYSDSYAAFFNPADADIQAYELSIISEVVAKYPSLYGIMLDRARYDGLNSDFSEESRSQFTSFLGQTIENYPADIFSWDSNGNRVPGKLIKSWLEWRAKVIYDFMNTARTTVKSLNSTIKFGVYTGAWYPDYYEVGVNWASKKYDPSADFEWASSNYKNYGFAALLDVYMTGVYYTDISGSGWYTVEGGLANVQKIMCNDVPVAGCLYAELYKDSPADMAAASKVCLLKSSGLTVFDIVQVINYHLWDAIKQGIDAAEASSK